MKAIIIDQPGPVENMYWGEAPMPEPGPGQVLIRVHATSVNRADTLQRQGLYPPPPGESPIMGLEVAGIVESTGENAQQWKPGDRVFALLAGGGYAEYVTVHESLVMPIPNKLHFEEAAGIAEVFLTAYQAICWLGKFQKGETALVHAGASGVGTAAIQLVKILGGKSIVTVGTQQKLDFCKKLGADFGINYTQENFAEKVRDYTQHKGANLIIDFIAGSYYEQNFKAIAVDGRWVVLALLGGRKSEEFDFGKLLGKRVQIMGSTLRSRSLAYKAELIQDFSDQFMQAFENNRLSPVIDQIWPIERVAEAHHYLENNQNMGKVILKVQ
ncbi:NAD(P)H-quinone oxidoreductase [Rapidithrix thailandica]|uniref:NAD(P)H-quinone oxidoreductase n=1 Tax=Rapidithrix thailandica TaxID=413964 RepID=A0AAW9S905_9BACT